MGQVNEGERVASAFRRVNWRNIAITLIIPRSMSVNACLQQLTGTTSDLGVKCFGATTIGDQTTEKQGVLVFCAWDSLRHRGSHCLELSHDPQQC
jgi:hypothetical protein